MSSIKDCWCSCTRLREAEAKAAMWDGIVRCKDCDLSTDNGEYCKLFASYEPIGGGDEYGESLAIVSPDGHCAWGKRRESEVG